MNLAEFARHDATGLADLVARREVTPKELAATAAAAIAEANPAVNAVVETYPDRIDLLDESKLGAGPFRGVPFLIKDVFGHEAGRLCEFGSRLAKGFRPEVDTHMAVLLRAAGFNIVGRTNAPEYSISCTTENALYGNTSTPWKRGYSAGGSTGGGMAAVVAGMVPIAQGGDIAGSIRVPASWCGGIGLRPSRGRMPAGPMQDEGGFGLLTNFLQTKSVRDTAAALDALAVPQVGDPFAIPRPAESYAMLIRKPAPKLRIGWSVAPLMGYPVDAEVAAAVEAAARKLADMGHTVEEAGPQHDMLGAARRFLDIWFFGFDLRLDALGAKTGRKAGPDTLEPTTLMAYAHAKTITPAQFLAAIAAMNAARRDLSRFFASGYDVWLSPTTATIAPPHGTFNLGRSGVTIETFAAETLAMPAEFTLPHNVMGTPAISLPLAMHSGGLPIGIQLGARPAQEHIVLQLAAALEAEMPWNGRVPPLHVSKG
jgi:amidase